MEALEVIAHNVLPGSFLDPPPEVDQYPAAHDAASLDGLVDAEDVGVHLPLVASARDVLDGGVVVESLRLLVPEVAEPVPLRRALRVEGPGVVVHDPGLLLVHVFLEDLAPEERFGPLEVQWCVERHADPGLDLAGGGCRHDCGCLAV